MARVNWWHLAVVGLIAQLFVPGVAPAQIHTNHDHIPDFAANPTIVTAANGSWTSASTWSPARVPGPSDIVRIRHLVSYEGISGDTAVIGVDTGGTLRFATNQSTRLRVGTLLVLPGGTLQVGTTANPIPAGVTAEILIANRALNLSSDPDQYGTGLIVVDGTVQIHGAPKTPTWLRLATEPHAGNTTLQLEQAVSGWAVNDLIVIPDSREDTTKNNDAQLERRTVQSISSDGRTITLSAPLTYTHPGARDLSGNVVFLAHVMNLTRNVVIRSENPSGTRGHTMYTARANVDIRYAEYRDLGRTTISPLSDSSNHIGRYAMHLHHLMGPPQGQAPANGYQFTVIGNSVVDNNTARSRIKWPIAIHNSHYGLLQGNTVYNAGGSGIVTEDGSESFNVIERNFVVRVYGEGDRRGGKGGSVLEPGSQGIGLWFRGPNNYVRNNVAADVIESNVEAGYGFEYFHEYLGDIRIPNFRGADTAVAGQYTVRSGYVVPILEFSGNEAYTTPQGLTYWWVGANWHTPVATADNVFRDLRIWHTSDYPVYAYQGNRIVFDGLQVYGTISSSQKECCNFLWFGDYKNVDTTIRNSTIVGIDSVILPYFAGGTTRVENSFIATYGGLINRTSGAPGACPGCNLPDRVQVISNVRYAALPGRSVRSVNMNYHTHGGSADFDSKDEVFVFAHQGLAGNDFRAYYTQQGTSNIAGGMAPCSDMTSRPDVIGITCQMSGNPPPPPTTTNPPSAPGNVRIVSSQ